ncbi:MAG: 30S ribosomal protein S17e [archaeon]
MGRIKTTQIKRMGNKIHVLHKEKLKKTFDGNKEVLPGIADIPSKKLRNVLAGYITRLMNKES